MGQSKVIVNKLDHDMNELNKIQQKLSVLNNDLKELSEQDLNNLDQFNTNDGDLDISTFKNQIK